MSKAMETVNTTINDAAHVIVGDAVHVSWQEILIRLAVALVIVGVGICLVIAGKKLLKALFNRKKAEQENEGQKKTLLSLLTNLLSFTVYFAAGCMALSALGVNVESILAVAGVGGLAIGFGCQTLVKDFVSGLFLWLEGNLKVGDVVTVGGLTGTVEKMALRTTSLRAANGNLYTIPNGDIRTVVNMTRDFRYALVDIVLAHSQDYQKAMDVMQAAMV
ncbi:MAG: mechanosensitive ion channel, partial [Clostridia bacterium]|nr:mechanosensitive ion channel [Clostridia bacterium]